MPGTAELGVGYISIIPDGSKIIPKIKEALGDVDAVAKKKGSSWGSAIADKLGGALKKSALGIGVSSGGMLAAGLTKGISRLTAIENAESKLRGLGNSAASVATIMENANAAVKGTAYGLDEAATTAAMAVASGIQPGKELEQVLTTVADTAGIAGTSMSEMGTIFGSVAARGKLQGDDLLQLTSRGIPVLQMLGKELGVTAAEVSEMVSKGEIDFKTFEKALRNGVGGAALEAGKTTQGAFKNMWAAAGRLGATLAGPFYSQAAGAFSGVTTLLDGVNSRLKPVMKDFGEWLSQSGIPKLQQWGKAAAEAFQRLAGSSEVQNALEGTRQVFTRLVEAGVGLAPALSQIGQAVAKASAMAGISGWNLFVTALNAAGVAAKAITPPLEVLSRFMNDHPAIVAAAVTAWAGFKTIPKIVSSAIDPVTDKFSGLKDTFLRVGTESKTAFSLMGQGVKDIQAYYQAAGQEIGSFSAAMQYAGTSSNKYLAALGSGYSQGSAGLMKFADAHRQAASAAKINALASSDAFTSIDFLAQQAGHSFVASAARMTGAANGFVSGGIDVMKTGAKSLVNFLGGPWSAALMAAGFVVGNFAEASASAEDTQRKIAEASSQAAEAQTELQKAVAGTTGALGEEGLAAAGKLAESALTEFTAKANQKLNMVDELNLATNGFDQLMGKIPGLTTETQRAATAQRAELKSVRDGYSELESAMDALGLPMSNLNSIVASGGKDYQALVQHLRESGEAGNHAADQLEGARAKVEASVAAARRLSPAFLEAKEAVQVLGDSSSSAEEKLSAMHRMMQVLGITPRDAEEAMMDAAEAVDQLSSKLQGAIDAGLGLGDALFTSEGRLDAQNANARLLSSTMGDLADKFQGAVLAGNDVDEAMKLIQPGLKEVQNQFGLTDEQLENLIKTFGMVPDEVVAQARLDGAPDVVKKLYEVRGALAEVPPGQTVEVQALTDEAVAHLESLGIKVEETPDGNFKVSAETEEAQQKLEFFTQQAAILGSTDIRPTAHLEANGLFLTADAARAQLQQVDRARPTPLADMDISRLDAAQIAALQEVGLLDGQDPTPLADMNIDQLTTEQQVALSRVFDLSKERPTPIADLNNDGIQDGADEADGWINDLWTKWNGKVLAMSMSVTRWISDKFSGSGHAAGGRVPGYATGGRLPVTGPGTQQTDGILGVDSYGMPTARVDRGEWVINRKSSEKYDRELDAINRGSFPKLPGYATGGKITADELDQFARGIEGAPYVWGGVHWGDCSGAVSALARKAVGLDPWGGRFSTANEGQALSSMGFAMGRGGPGDLRIGWFNGGPWGGHTSATLPNGVNVEMGGARGNGQYGGQAAGADHPQYTDHAYRTIKDPEPETLTYRSRGDDPEALDLSRTRSGTVASQAPTSWSDVVGIMAKDAASGYTKDALDLLGIPDTPPALAAWNQYKADKAEQEAEKEQTPTPTRPIASTSSKEGDIAYDPAKGATQWTPVVEAALKKLGISLANTTRTIEQIDIESGGDPKAVNNWDSNASAGDPSKGLLQVIGATFQRYRAQDLPNDATDPLANIYAAANYAQTRYGALEKIWPTRNGYALGGWVAGAGNMIADAIPAMLSNGEYVVKASRAALFGPILEAINGDRPLPTHSPQPAPEYHIHGADPGEVMRKLQAHEATQSMQFLGG